MKIRRPPNCQAPDLPNLLARRIWRPITHPEQDVVQHHQEGGVREINTSQSSCHVPSFRWRVRDVRLDQGRGGVQVGRTGFAHRNSNEGDMDTKPAEVHTT
eukprot:239395-Amorphochlora_amoeboformis.AAC.1